MRETNTRLRTTGPPRELCQRQMRNQRARGKERLEICFGNTVRSMVSRRDGKLAESRKDGKSALAVSVQVASTTFVSLQSDSRRFVLDQVDLSRLSCSEKIARDHDHHFCKY